MSAAHAVGGLSPARYQAILLTQDLAGAALLYILLSKILVDRKLAGFAAALAYLYPVHPATHHWFANMVQTSAQDFILASLILHFSFLENRRRGRLAAAMILYLMGVLSYEATALMPALLIPALIARELETGRSLRQSALTAGKDLAPFAAMMILGLVWQKLGIAAVFHYQSPKTTSFSAGAIAAALGGGADCLTRQAAGLIEQCALLFYREQDPRLWSACAVLSLFAAWAFARPTAESEAPAVKRSARRRHPREERPRPASDAAILAWTAALAFAAAYPLYGIAGYALKITGLMSRTNGFGGLAAGLGLAAALWPIVRRVPRAIAALLVAMPIAAFTWTNWLVASHWAQSWSLQRAAVNLTASAAARLPHDSKLIVEWREPQVFAADMFFYDEPWGFAAAIKVASGRADLYCTLRTPWMTSERDAVVERMGGQIIRKLTYDNLFLFRFDDNAITKLVPPN